MTIQQFRSRIEEAAQIVGYVATASDVDEKLAEHEVKTLKWVLEVFDEEMKSDQGNDPNNEVPLLTQALQELRNNERWLGWMTGNMEILQKFAVTQRDLYEKECSGQDLLDKQYTVGCRNTYQIVVEKINALCK